MDSVCVPFMNCLTVPNLGNWNKRFYLPGLKKNTILGLKRLTRCTVVNPLVAHLSHHSVQ